MCQPVVKICTLYGLVYGYGSPQWLVVELLIIVGSSPTNFLGYWKFGCWASIVSFQVCLWIWVESNFWHVASAGFVARLTDQGFDNIYDGSGGFIERFVYWLYLFGFNQGKGS